eukprot:scaffold18245_cov72-Phaeocystis_antarctica.AAC.1
MHSVRPCHSPRHKVPFRHGSSLHFTCHNTQQHMVNYILATRKFHTSGIATSSHWARGISGSRDPGRAERARARVAFTGPVAQSNERCDEPSTSSAAGSAPGDKKRMLASLAAACTARYSVPFGAFP